MNKTIHGTFIPDWGKNETGKNITLTFVLTGKIPSKKNRQRASFNYSWAIGQVKTFFKTRNSVKRVEAIKFIIQLIRNIKPFIFKPADIVEWEEIAGNEITSQAHAILDSPKFSQHGIIFPVDKFSLKVRFYWADEYRRDSSNRFQTIEDLLVSRKIIADDDYKNLSKGTFEAKCFKDKITKHITVISLTVYGL